VNGLIVVSGLPRTGTSMMMRMLEAGGLSMFTDDVRKADEDNPNGYYEHSKVETLGVDDSYWILDVGSKVIKITSEYLCFIPENIHVELIYMTRHLDEVLQSQRKMELRKGIVSEKSDSVLKKYMLKHSLNIEKYLKRRRNIEVLYVPHFNCIDKPKRICNNIQAFLDKDLDVEAMMGVVDKSLYHNRRYTE